MKTKQIILLFLLSLMPVNLMVLAAQVKIAPYFQISYLKNTDGERYLKASLTYSRNRMEVPIPGMKISFFTGTDKKTELPAAVTDNKGVAMISLASDLKIPAAADGSWSFLSQFPGNDSLETASSDITITDVILDMNLALVDSVKTISLSAKKVKGGSESPASGETVIVYVPRMFSMLPLGEVTLDDTGSGNLAFPSDLPGDKTGGVTIIAKFEDNPTFGTVEKKQTLSWGVPAGYQIPTAHRALWTKGAPKWMIYTLSVLLAGVWGHYLYAIISLIRISIVAKSEKKKEKYEL